MRCNKCLKCDIKVIESRDVEGEQAIRRRRMCLNCGYRFTTYERIERPQIVVIKRSGNRQLFSREKILSGLYRACEKTTVASIRIERLVSEIEDQIYDMAETEISSNVIGDLIMEKLQPINEVAYVRFASVYRRFKDISSFENELLKFKQKNKELVK